jgi:dienelactone hydrolase
MGTAGMTPMSMTGTGGTKTTTPPPITGSGGATTPITGTGGKMTMPMTMGTGGHDAGVPMTDGGAGSGDMKDGSVASAGSCGAHAFACRGDAPTMANSIGTMPGPYKVGMYTDGYRDGPDYADSTIYYPMDADPPFGCVSVVPGFVSPQSSIQNWGPFLASHGIAAITIGTNSPTDTPDIRAMALMDALETCKSENDRMGSPLMGHIDKDHLGVSGWSMGGGGTLIAASMNSTLKAAVSFAAWGPTGGTMNMVPALMFEATADPLAAGMSNSFYMDTPDSVSKMLFEVNGAGHDVANDPANSNGIIGLYGLSWFKLFLEGDERYKPLLTAKFPDICTPTCVTNLK